MNLAVAKNGQNADAELSCASSSQTICWVVFDHARQPLEAISLVATEPLPIPSSSLRWGPLVERLAKEVSPERNVDSKAALERLGRRAWVYYAADLAAEDPRANVYRAERRELAARVAEHDRFLFKWAMPLFADEYEDTLRDISRGTGLRDDAEDVLRLVALYRENWQAIAGMQQFVTEARLEQAAADATKQLDLLRIGASNPTRVMADAAYSLWFVDYDDLLHLGRYLCRREVDVLLRFPGVRELPTNRPDGEDDGVDDDAVDDAIDASAPEQAQQPPPAG